MMNTLYCHLVGYQIGCYINNNPDNVKDYVGEYCLTSNEKTFFNITEEHLELFHNKIKSEISFMEDKLNTIKFELTKAINFDLKYILSFDHILTCLNTCNSAVKLMVPNLVYYYFKVDKSLVIDLFKTYHSLIVVFDKFFTNVKFHINVKEYQNLNFDHNLNFFTKTLDLIQEDNSYFKIKDFSYKELEEIFNIYKEIENENK